MAVAAHLDLILLKAAGGMREEIKKPASELAGCNETFKQLEPEDATEVEAAAGCQV
jgi:hypothetical protein